MRSSAIIALLIVGLDAMGLGLIMPVLPTLLRELVPAEQVAGHYGALLSLYALMQVVFAPMLGQLSDSYGRRPVLLASLAGAAVDYTIMASAPVLWVLYIGRLVSGVTGATGAVAASTIADSTGEGSRARWFGYMGACYGAGMIAGPALGGMLGGISAHAPFIAAALLNGFAFLLACIFLKETHHSHGGTGKPVRIKPFVLLRLDDALRGLGALFAVFLNDRLASPPGKSAPFPTTAPCGHTTTILKMKQRVSLRTLALLSVVVLITGCSKPEAQQAAQEPAEVGVIVAAATPTSVATELPGRLEPYREAEVRARVAGIVTARLYEEGQDVARGAALFQIDPAPLQAAYDSEAANLARAQANLSAAADKLRRYADLVSDRAISERDHAESVAQERQARAEVALARANLQSAKLKLDYARVTSPIDGRARRALVTEGALVGEGQATPLTVVQQIDPIYVNFAQPAAEVMQLQKQIRAGALESVAPDQVRVRLLLPDGSEYARGGTLSFADLAVDPGTDNVTMRALFENPGRDLLPGMYVRVRLEQAINRDTYLVPRNALLRNAEGAHVLAAGPDGELKKIAVTAHRLQGANWIVTQGLAGGERIVVENAAHLAAGQKIKPVERAAPSAQAAAAENPEAGVQARTAAEGKKG